MSQAFPANHTLTVPPPGSEWHPASTETPYLSLPTLVSLYHHRVFLLRQDLPFESVLNSIVDSQQTANPPLPPIQVDREQGAMLAILAKQAVLVGKGYALEKGEKDWGSGGKIVEVGTLGGYSTVWMGKGLQQKGGKPLGKIISIDIMEHHVKLARENVAKAGMSDFIDIWNLPGPKGMERLLETDKEEENGTSLGKGNGWKNRVDLIFLDADKSNSLNYLLLSLKLCRPGGLIICDNSTRQGSVIDEYNTTEEGFDKTTKGLREMNEEIGKKLESGEIEIGTALQTVGEKAYDGFTVLVKGTN